MIFGKSPQVQKHTMLLLEVKLLESPTVQARKMRRRVGISIFRPIILFAVAAPPQNCSVSFLGRSWTGAAAGDLSRL